MAVKQISCPECSRVIFYEQSRTPRCYYCGYYKGRAEQLAKQHEAPSRASSKKPEAEADNTLIGINTNGDEDALRKASDPWFIEIEDDTDSDKHRVWNLLS